MPSCLRARPGAVIAAVVSPSPWPCGRIPHSDEELAARGMSSEDTVLWLPMDHVSNSH